ncbi:MAG: hypothetical protein IJO61_03820, partial [Oscillospiraceae bacterium]|nr:hypothetical protein [Oscillospiraceae bacterium]
VSPLSHKAGFAGTLFLWAREFSPFSRSLLTFLAKQESKNPFGNLPETKEGTPGRVRILWPAASLEKAFPACLL